MAKKFYTVENKDLYRGKEFYGELKPKLFARSLIRENPFFPETFPAMKDISYSIWTERGTLYVWQANDDKRYDDMLRRYINGRYVLNAKEALKTVSSITAPKFYNVVTGEKIMPVLSDFLHQNTKLVVKRIDLGEIYARNMYNRVAGNNDLGEIYNEIRVGFFLNELRYAYSSVVTEHFMTVVDWFVSDVNYYPIDKGIGPFQYIISEKLDSSLSDYLLLYPNMETLRCTLFSIAHALEVAWATHKFVHYDFHENNVMLKDAPPAFIGKDYLYTRPGNKRVYRLPGEGTNGMMVKILDFGRCHMHVPPPLTVNDKRDVFDHITEKGHIHNKEIFYVRDTNHLGDDVVVKEPDRANDLRRLFIDLLTRYPVDYWETLRGDKKKPDLLYIALVRQLKSFLSEVKTGSAAETMFNGKDLEKVLFSQTRGLYLKLKKDGVLVVDRETEVMTFTDEFTVALQKIHDSKRQREIAVANLKTYHAWLNDAYNTVRLSVSTLALTVSDFLSSDLFSGLIKTEFKNEKQHVWMGKWPEDLKEYTK